MEWQRKLTYECSRHNFLPGFAITGVDQNTGPQWEGQNLTSLRHQRMPMADSVIKPQ